MLLPNKLNTYLEQCKTAIASINHHQVLTDESEFGEFIREIDSDDAQVILIGVQPNIRLKGDEDNPNFVNHTLFYCVKKTDSKAGHADYLNIFEDCGNAVQALLDKFIIDQTEGAGRCDIGEFIFNGSSIEPVRGYMGTNGWVLSLDLVTY